MQTSLTPLIPGNIYHVWTHAVGDENFFRTKYDYFTFLKKYENYIVPIANTIAYCLLPNHFHLMLRVKEEAELIKYYEEINELKRKSGVCITGTTEAKDLPAKLSKQVSNFLNSYAKTHNNKYERKGTLFQRPFHRKLIESDEYFTTLIAYIHNNPIHHGFTDNLNDWPYSSWHSYILNNTTRLTNNNGINYYKDQKDFLRKHQEAEALSLMEIFEL